MTLSLDTAPIRRAASPPSWSAYALSLGAVAAATLLAVLVDRAMQAPNTSLVFVLPVVIAAASFGWGPALTAAVAGVVAYNFFLIEPRYTLHVADPANVWALALLLITAAIVSAVATQARRRAIDALKAADQALALQALARALVGAADRTAIVQAAAGALGRLFDAPATVLIEDDGGFAQVELAGGAVLSPADREAARWAMASRLPTRGGAYPVPESAYDFWPVMTPQRRHCAIGLRISGRDAGRPSEPERLVEIVGGYLSVALDREEFSRQAEDARVDAAGQRLRTDLLAAVSHDLKTPLSTILLTLQSLLRFGEGHDAAARTELLKLAEAETGRLNGLVTNLLDMNRLEAGAVTARRTPSNPAGLTLTALERASAALAGHRVVNEVTSEAAPLMVDPTLFESALANVLENAGKYAPSGSPIRIKAGCDGGSGWVEVLDQGPGFPGAAEPLFERFARGVAGDGRAPGTGLGLSIARGFMEAQGGRIEAANRTDGPGARVRLWAPLAQSTLETAQ